MSIFVHFGYVETIFAHNLRQKCVYVFLRIGRFPTFFIFFLLHVLPQTPCPTAPVNPASVENKWSLAGLMYTEGPSVDNSLPRQCNTVLAIA